MKRKPILGKGAVLAGFLLLTGIAKAQTADDALMMGKKQWCNDLPTPIPAGQITGRER